MFGTSGPAARAYSIPGVIWTGVVRPDRSPLPLYLLIGCQRKLSTLHLLPAILARSFTRVVGPCGIAYTGTTMRMRT